MGKAVDPRALLTHAAFSPRAHLLEHANASPPLALPVLRVWVEPLQDVKRLGRIQKVAHLGEKGEKELGDGGED